MRDTWYGDKRDLVKWGTLAHIAQRESLDLIVQVPYLRCGERPPLHTNLGHVQIDIAVWSFFRNVYAVEALGAAFGRRIVVIQDAFDRRKRETYRQRVASELARFPQPKVVLLDPDTGIAAGRASGEHVDAEDIKAAWYPLRIGDWLVVYQHASRRKTWREEAQQRFVAACDAKHTEVFTAPEIAWDVAFISAKKFRV